MPPTELNLERLLETSRKIYADSQSADAVIYFLRAETQKKTVSIAVLAELLNIPLGEAKEMVHHSVVWQNEFRRDEEFRKIIFSALGDMTDVVAKTCPPSRK